MIPWSVVLSIGMFTAAGGECTELIDEKSIAGAIRCLEARGDEPGTEHLWMRALGAHPRLTVDRLSAVLRRHPNLERSLPGFRACLRPGATIDPSYRPPADVSDVYANLALHNPTYAQCFLAHAAQSCIASLDANERCADERSLGRYAETLETTSAESAALRTRLMTKVQNASIAESRVLYFLAIALFDDGLADKLSRVFSL